MIYTYYMYLLFSYLLAVNSFGSSIKRANRDRNHRVIDELTSNVRKWARVRVEDRVGQCESLNKRVRVKVKNNKSGR